jgi:hypothetical protein
LSASTTITSSKGSKHNNLTIENNSHLLHLVGIDLLLYSGNSLGEELRVLQGLDELYSLEQEEKILKDLESHLLLTTCPKRARMNTQGKMGQASASENQLCKDQITLKKNSQIYWDTLKFLRLKFMHLHSSNARTYQLKSSFNRQICVRRGQEFVGDLLPKPRSFVSHSIASAEKLPSRLEILTKQRTLTQANYH